MSGNSCVTHGYVSMIKVNGVPILPPLITDEMRPQLQAWKKAAIEKERAMFCKRAAASARVLSEMTDSALDTATATCSTDLRQYMQCTSGASEASSTIAESLPTSQSVTPTQSPRKPRVRSASFTVEHPTVVFSPADVAQASSSKRNECKSQIDTTPIKSTRSFTDVVNNDAVFTSPVINSPKVPYNIVSPVILQADVQKIEEMDKILEDYHNLQFEELKLRQKKEIENLIKQKIVREEILNQSESESFLSVVDSLTPTPIKSPSPMKRAKRGSTRSCDPPSVNSPPHTYHLIGMLSARHKSTLGAMIKGYLIRRIMLTERVLLLKKTVKEIIELPQEEEQEKLGDDMFESMMKAQLIAARVEISVIFFGWNPASRMKLIERHRCLESNSKHSNLKCSRRLSSATVKSLARKGVMNESISSSNSTPRKKRHLGLKLTVPSMRRSPNSINSARTRRKSCQPLNHIQPRTCSSASSYKTRLSTAGQAMKGIQSLNLHDRPWR